MSQNKVWSRMTDKRFIKWKPHFMLKCNVMKKMNRKSTVLAPGECSSMHQVFTREIKDTKIKPKLSMHVKS